MSSRNKPTKKEERKKLVIRIVCIAVAATMILLAAIEALPALMQ